jgi:hypothetical protein
MLHVIPLLDDSVLHWVADLEHCASRRRLIAAHDVLDDQVTVRLLLGSQDRPSYDGRELVLGEVLTGVSDLEEAGAAIEN